MADKKKYCEVFSLKLKEDFYKHLEARADEKKLKVGTYMKAILKKHTGYKEKELI